MDAAVALPEDQLRARRSASRVEPAERQIRIPEDHLIERHAHLVGGVAAEMLVGQHQQLLAALPRPGHDLRGVARRADDAAVLAAEAFDGGGRVDVRHRDRRSVTPSVPQFLPADLELIDRGHVGHRAAGGQVRQDHLLVRRAEDVGALGHEVDAAEDDELGRACWLAAYCASFSESPV